MSIFFGIPPGDIVVHAPPIGGGFGGKAGIQLEGLAFLLSKTVGGRPVRLVNTREEDMVSSPGHIGLEATVRLGATFEGRLIAMDALYLFDSGGYADYAVNISRAGAIAATGPYNIPNVRADALCVYTNHPFATAYRGFGHEIHFAIARAMAELASVLEMDPVELHTMNAIQPGDLSPTQSVMDSNTGDLVACIRQAAEMIEWDACPRRQIDDHTVRAKGMGCFWKAPAMPTNADAGAVLTFNEDGSVNLSTGIVEIGQGTYAGLIQIVAEALQIDPALVHVAFNVETRRSPHDWATAASRSLFMAGRAALQAVEDAKEQLKQIASGPMRCPPEDLVVAEGWITVRDEPDSGLPMSDVALGYMYPDGTATGGQVIGRGNYISRWLTDIDPETGEGYPALEWTIGAEAVEVEVDLRDGSYRVLKAVSAMDVGHVINPDLARGQVVGAMAMALGGATSEGFIFDGREQVRNAALRDFKLPRIDDAPEYEVAFIETPQGDGPYGARGLGEQGVLGIYGALSNAISRAIGQPMNDLPITPEKIWRALHAPDQDDKEGGAT
jgi:CO/xanthine dehydrogenase Mo-binding subunit